MKTNTTRTLALLLVSAGLASCAQHQEVLRYDYVSSIEVPHTKHHVPHWRLHNGYWIWVMPRYVNGMVRYEVSNPQPSPIHQPVIVDPNSRCTEWREIRENNRVIRHERICR